MNPDVKRQWVDTLRNGEYQQGKGQLAWDGQYCCLGVLCDVAVKSGLGISVEPSPDGMGTKFDGESILLPNSVMEWAGLTRKDGGFAFLPNGESQNLPVLNDEEYSFSEIADVIEEQL